jgi:cbb3-type cytochrome oxidase subunit 3
MFLTAGAPVMDGLWAPDEMSGRSSEPRRRMTAETTYEPSHVSVRTKISALWTAMLFIFAYVDIFSLYRPKFRAELEAGEIGGFTVTRGSSSGPPSTS